MLVQQTGGPELLGVLQVDLPSIDRGEARLRVAFAGLNLIDVYHRRGDSRRALTFTPGVEGPEPSRRSGQGTQRCKANTDKRLEGRQTRGMMLLDAHT